MPPGAHHQAAARNGSTDHARARRAVLIYHAGRPRAHGAAPPCILKENTPRGRDNLSAPVKTTPWTLG